MGTKHIALEKHIISLKFLLLYAGQTWLGYFAVYLNDSGYSDQKVAILYGAYQATLFFIVAVWGVLSDKFGVRKIYLLLSIISALLLAFLTNINQFYLLVIYMIILSGFLQPCALMLESISIYYIHQNSQSSFGAIRMFGSIGWGIASPLLGIFIDKKHPGIIFPYAAIMVSLTAILAIVLLRLDKQKISGVKIELKSLKYFFQGSFLFFMIIIFLAGFCVAPMSHILSLYYQTIGAKNAIIEVNFSLQTVFEIPFFFFGAYIVRKFGAPKSILFSLVISAIRLAFYGSVTNPNVALIAGSLHGFTFSMFVTGVVEYIQKNVPSTLRSTGQSLFWAFHFGAGYTMGSLWLGFLRDFYNINQIMYIQSIIMVFVFLLAVYYFRNFQLKLTTTS